MAQINSRATYKGPRTHEGGRASKIDAVEQLRRSVMATMLWEDGFYEDGEAIADRIVRLTKEVGPQHAREIMIEAKRMQKLRHAPLVMAVAMLEQGWLDPRDVDAVVDRADEIAEILAMYWRGGKKPVPHALRKGLARAFGRFDEYQLAKYDRAKAVRLRDVMRMVRPKPADEAQAQLWGRLIRGELATPDTWEVALSGGADKRTAFTRLLQEGKLGDLAFIRNLRNMVEAGVDMGLIKASFATRRWNRMLPFQFVAAARHVPILEPEIEAAMLSSMEGMEKISGKVAILVDGSGSMGDPLSSKSDMTRFDAACGLAILARELCTDVEIYRFNEVAELVPARRGFALRDALGRPRGGTMMWRAVMTAAQQWMLELMVVITDEQTQDSGSAADANAGLLAVVNVANSERGVGYGKGSIHVSGWSENVIAYLREALKQ